MQPNLWESAGDVWEEPRNNATVRLWETERGKGEIDKTTLCGYCLTSTNYHYTLH